MRQRAMIAMALALEPAVLIADEPSTALDVTIQAQIIELLQDLNQEHGLSVILITHDLGVVAEIADRVLVMYAGQVVEQGSLDEIFYDPQHPYTWGLLGSIARLDQDRPDRLPQIGGQPPSLLAPPPGCRFAPRCPHRFEKCSELPALEERAAEGQGPRRSLLARSQGQDRSCVRSTAGSGSKRRRSSPSHGQGRSDPRGRAPRQALPDQVGDLLRPDGRRASRPSTTSASPCTRARPSGWSASRAAASRRSAGRSSSCSSRPPAP